VANITAKAPNPQTVVLHTSVPDPKLPVMDVYVLPKHIWSKQSKSAIGKYAATDGVGSGPYTLDRVQKGQFWTLKANPNYWKGKPRVDRVVFRKFNNGDAGRGCARDRGGGVVLASAARTAGQPSRRSGPAAMCSRAASSGVPGSTYSCHHVAPAAAIAAT
jgi:ABC-type transport system substrate-binding protein